MPLGDLLTNLADRFQKVIHPFGKSAGFDITDYVVAKSVEGHFRVAGQEEKKIRGNPVEQITPLLKEVFGKR